jgi:hypothetical protein
MRTWLLSLALAPALLGCPSVAPPISQVPTGDAAIERLRATGACGESVQANAKIDQFGEHGRVRGDVMLFAAAPAKVRLDVVSPFGVALATLTSDGDRFALADLREKRFYFGPASACNIARLTTVPVPGHALVSLLRGQAPVLKHDPAGAKVEWSSKGYYVVTLASTRDASEVLHIAPHPEDFARPWTEQRMRLRQVVVRQYGGVRYQADLDDFAPAPMAGPRVDPDHLEPDLPPSGPECHAELPRKIHVEVPDEDEDVNFRYVEVTWNPPLPEGTFVQAPPPGMQPMPVRCE